MFKKISICLVISPFGRNNKKENKSAQSAKSARNKNIKHKKNPCKSALLR